MELPQQLNEALQKAARLDAAGLRKDLETKVILPPGLSRSEWKAIVPVLEENSRLSFVRGARFMWECYQRASRPVVTGRKEGGL